MLRKLTLALIVAVGLATLASLALYRGPAFHLHCKTCFNDVQGLRPGATVRIAGVDVGTVRGVRANTQRKECPAEVDLEVAASYEIDVPRDAVAKIARIGILGETYVDIDISQATGEPIENHGYLKSKPTASLQDEIRAAQVVVEAAKAAANTTPREDKPSPHPH